MATAKTKFQKHYNHPLLQGLLDTLFAFDPDPDDDSQALFHEEIEWAVWALRDYAALTAAFSILVDSDTKKQVKILAQKIKQTQPISKEIPLNNNFDGLRLILGGKSDNG